MFDYYSPVSSSSSDVGRHSYLVLSRSHYPVSLPYIFCCCCCLVLSTGPRSVLVWSHFVRFATLHPYAVPLCFRCFNVNFCSENYDDDVVPTSSWWNSATTCPYRTLSSSSFKVYLSLEVTVMVLASNVWSRFRYTLFTILQIFHGTSVLLMKVSVRDGDGSMHFVLWDSTTLCSFGTLRAFLFFSYRFLFGNDCDVPIATLCSWDSASPH